MRNLVLDIDTSLPVANSQLHGGLQHDGATRIDESSAQLPASDDNVLYTPIECIYRELYPYILELADIELSGRYYKIDCTVSDMKANLFSTGTYWGGPRAFYRP